MTVKKVFVTGGAGQTGIHALKWICSEMKDYEVVSGVWKEKEQEQSKRLKNLNVRTQPIDGLDKRSLVEAFRDVQSLYIIPPGLNAKVEIAKNYIDAAKEAGVQFVLLLSVAGVENESFTWARQFGQIEEHLKSKIDQWCILRTSFYSENILLYKDDMVNQSILPISMGTGCFSPVDCGELGLCAARILASPTKHKGRTYMITGPSCVTGAMMAYYFSRLYDKKITYEICTQQEVKKLLKSRGINESEIDGLADWYRLCSEGNLSVLCCLNNFEEICGRQPKSFAQFVCDHKMEFGATSVGGSQK